MKTISYSNYLKAESIERYNPKFNRFILSLGVVGIVGCLITPCTNFFIPGIIKGVWKYG